MQSNKHWYYAGRELRRVPVIVAGILIIIASKWFDFHFITPGKIDAPFMNEFSWTFTSPTWLDVVIYCCCLFTIFYFRVVKRKHMKDLLSMIPVTIVSIGLFAGAISYCAFEERGERLIDDMLASYQLKDIILPAYKSFAFSILAMNALVACVGIFFNVLGDVIIASALRVNRAIHGIVQITFLCICLGSISGLVLSVELLLHHHYIDALIYGPAIMLGGMLFNALFIASAGMPLVLAEKLFSASTDRKEKEEKAKRKRFK